MKEMILTGLRTNDEYHLGNYLGGIRPMVDMAVKHADKYDMHMFIPDLHSFTTPIDHSTFYERSLKNLKVFFASGLPMDDENVRVYRQSHVQAHSELTIILNNFAPFGQLSRMVEFKEKRDKLDDVFVSVGLFDYPVLMASDILLYGAKYVPLGDDQRQHIELARDLAERFNNKFGETFVLPATIKEQAKFVGIEEPLRIMSLQNPDKKMSKSVSDPSGTIMLMDDPGVARKKVMSAVTDSVGLINFDRKAQPGISNLLTLLSTLSSRTIDDVKKEFVGQAQYGGLKTAVADEVEKLLTGVRTKFATLDDEVILKKLKADEIVANEMANVTLLKVQKAVGLRA